MILSLLMLASLPISRIIVRMQHSGAIIPRGMTLAQRQENYGTLVPTVPPVLHRGDSMSRLLATCQPCQTFLADMRQDPSPSSLARKTWVKWNRTLVNRWKKNNVALYSPSNVRMLLWADAALFSSYEAVLPPAPPARSTSRESLLSAGRPVTSPAIPGDDGGDQDRGSPWSGFEEAIPPNQEARPVTPPVQTTQPPPEAVPGPSLLPTPTQPSSEPTLSMLMQMLSGFQSEMKNLRNELSGSVSSLVAEAMANQLPQVNISPCLTNLCTMFLYHY